MMTLRIFDNITWTLDTKVSFRVKYPRRSESEIVHIHSEFPSSSTIYTYISKSHDMMIDADA